MADDLDRMMAKIREFAFEREWQRFHTPKNLAMALAGEVGELAAELQWFTDEQVASELAGDEFRRNVSSEVADVMTYLLRFCDVAGIDPAQAVYDKLELNESRYPAELSSGSAAKYNELGHD